MPLKFSKLRTKIFIKNEPLNGSQMSIKIFCDIYGLNALMGLQKVLEKMTIQRITNALKYIFIKPLFEMT